MPPKFSLQAVLDYHHRRVEILEAELGRLQKKLREWKLAKEALIFEKSSCYEDLLRFQKGEMDLATITRIRDHIESIDLRIAKVEEEIISWTEKVEKQRKKVIAAKQDEAVFEKLRDRELERYQEKMEQQEKVLIDDIYTSKAHFDGLHFAHQEEVYP